MLTLPQVESMEEEEIGGSKEEEKMRRERRLVTQVYMLFLLKSEHYNSKVFHIDMILFIL